MHCGADTYLNSWRSALIPAGESKVSRVSERQLRAAWILTEEGSHTSIRSHTRRWMRYVTHTLRPLHDTIGPSFVAATGITDPAATLVTTQYGLVAEWVHVQHRQVAAGHESNARAKRPVAHRAGSPCHDAARRAAVHSPVRVTHPGMTADRSAGLRRSADSRAE
ncbi:hypothetical protein GCM10020358_48620 [Amorphoplanes nipponensis]|uniref:Uncharacterized protein n=1 Tax=Actinoplanes nipponensis TaxID=135950 RepID=A0A919MWU9_9ACTN|nr:hypothetical protein Ani05nite_61290 [Actinoplanes nipponensis]